MLGMPTSFVRRWTVQKASERIGALWRTPAYRSTAMCAPRSRPNDDGRPNRVTPPNMPCSCHRLKSPVVLLRLVGRKGLRDPQEDGAVEPVILIEHGIPARDRVDVFKA